MTRAEVFYFDDLEAKTRRGASGNVRTPAPVDGGPGPQAAPADQLSVVDEPTVVVAPADQGPAPGLDGVGTAPIGTTPPSGRDRKRGRPGPKSVAASVLAAAAVCVALVALGLSLSSGDGAHAAGHPPAGGKASQGTTVPGRHPRPLHHKNLPKATTTSRPTTVPTTRPPTAALIATGPGTASFRLSSARLPLTLAATGACWTEVRAGGASGRLLYVGTLQAGQHYSFKAPAWARLGDPSQVSVHLGGTGLHASGLLTGDPINLRFSVG